MPRRIQKTKRYRDDADQQYETITDGEDRRLKNEAIDRQHKNPKPKQDKLEDLDDLIDEIDEVLEENAQEFVAQYIQKGGQ